MIKLKTIKKTIGTHENTYSVCQIRSEMIYESDETKTNLALQVPLWILEKVSKKYPDVITQELGHSPRIILQVSKKIPLAEVEVTEKEFPEYGCPSEEQSWEDRLADATIIKSQKLAENSATLRLYDKAMDLLDYITDLMASQRLIMSDTREEWTKVIDEEYDYITDRI